MYVIVFGLIVIRVLCIFLWCDECNLFVLNLKNLNVNCFIK